MDGFLEKEYGHAEVEQGATEHVTTDAGRAIEMEMGRGHGNRID